MNHLWKCTFTQGNMNKNYEAIKYFNLTLIIRDIIK